MSVAAANIETATQVAGRPSRRSLRFDSIFTASSGVAASALGVITGPLLARNLGPAGRGDLAAVLVPTEMLGWLLCFGIPLAAVYNSRRYSARQLVMASWVFAAIVGGAIALASWWIIPWYLRDHAPETIQWFRVFMLSAIVFAPVTTVVELLTARGRIIQYSFWRVFPFVANAFLLVALAITGRLTLGSALAAAFVANALWFVGVIAANQSWPGRGFRPGVLFDQLHYGGRVIIGSVSHVFVSRFDQFLLVGLVPARELGFYVVAVSAASISAPVSEGIATALFPRLIHSRDTGEKQGFGQAIRWSTASSILSGAAIAALAPWVIPWLFGGAFRSSLVALWVLLPGQTASNLATVASQKLMADNRPGTVSASLVAAAIVTVIGLAVAAPPFGVLGAAIVTTVSQLVLLLFVGMALVREGHRDPAGGAGVLADAR
jgi:O-antigen/teichoic acid export membrane protein